MEKFKIKNNRPEFDAKIIAPEIGFLFVNELTSDQTIDYAMYVLEGGDSGEFNGNTSSFLYRNGEIIIDSEYHKARYPFKINYIEFKGLLDEWHIFLEQNKFKLV